MSFEPLVHVVDDDAAVRDSLVLLLECAGHVAQAHDDAGQFLARLDEARPGCVLADVRMPGMSGLDLQRHLKQSGIGLPVIIITGHGDVSMAVRALKGGAADFIEKPFDTDHLLGSVALALDQGCRVHRDRQELSAIRDRLTGLTPREREVMDLVVVGLANKSVADRLGISVRTVEIHRARVMEKMDAQSLSELVRMALRLEDGGV